MGYKLAVSFTQNKLLLQKNSQLTTEEIYNQAQNIYPEMCDDNRRYSNGEKKWKIEVRQSRFFLQRKGIVEQVPDMPHCWTLNSDFMLGK